MFFTDPRTDDLKNKQTNKQTSINVMNGTSFSA